MKKQDLKSQLKSQKEELLINFLKDPNQKPVWLKGYYSTSWQEPLKYVQVRLHRPSLKPESEETLFTYETKDWEYNSLVSKDNFQQICATRFFDSIPDKLQLFLENQCILGTIESVKCPIRNSIIKIPELGVVFFEADFHCYFRSDNAQKNRSELLNKVTAGIIKRNRVASLWTQYEQLLREIYTSTGQSFLFIQEAIHQNSNFPLPVPKTESEKITAKLMKLPFDQMIPCLHMVKKITNIPSDCDFSSKEISEWVNFLVVNSTLIWQDWFKVPYGCFKSIMESGYLTQTEKLSRFLLIGSFLNLPVMSPPTFEETLFRDGDRVYSIEEFIGYPESHPLVQSLKALQTLKSANN